MKTTDQDLVPAELVSLNLTTPDSIQRTKIKSDKQLIGVVSTNPGFVGNISVNVDNSNPNFKLIAMTGQLPVKVNTENGNIAVGDSITSSSTPGQGMKANVDDSTIGIAEEGATASGLISVLITRDNRGLSTNLINLAKVNWVELNNQITTTENVGIGLPSSYPLDTQLEVANGIKLVSSTNSQFTNFGVGSIDFINNTIDVGIRQTSSGLEYKATGTSNWQAISGIVIDNYRVDAGVAKKVAFQSQTSGWGYVQGNGISNNISSSITYPVKFKDIPNVAINVAGIANTKPVSLTDCNQPSISSHLVINNATNLGFNLSLAVKPDTNYYCYSWISLGSQ